LLKSIKFPEKLIETNQMIDNSLFLLIAMEKTLGLMNKKILLCK